MPDTTDGQDAASRNEIQVVLSTKMIDTVNVPLKPLLVRFAVPEAWFLADVSPSVAPPVPPPPPPPPPPPGPPYEAGSLISAQTTRVFIGGTAKPFKRKS